MAYDRTQNRTLILVHVLLFYVLKICFNVVLPSTVRLSKWRLSFVCFKQTLFAYLFFPVFTMCPSHLIRISGILGDEGHNCAFFSSILFFLRLGSTYSPPNILSLCSSLNVRGQVSAPCKTGRIMVVLDRYQYWNVVVRLPAKRLVKNAIYSFDAMFYSPKSSLSVICKLNNSSFLYLLYVVPTTCPLI